MNIPGMDKLPNMDSLKQLNEYLDYPVSKSQIIQAADQVHGVPDFIKQQLQDRLPEGDYKNFDDIKKAVGF